MTLNVNKIRKKTTDKHHIERGLNPLFFYVFKLRLYLKRNENVLKSFINVLLNITECLQSFSIVNT